MRTSASGPLNMIWPMAPTTLSSWRMGMRLTTRVTPLISCNCPISALPLATTCDSRELGMTLAAGLPMPSPVSRPRNFSCTGLI
ncbi:hypothetical protein D3C72_1847570 [compost metagenome]